MPACPRCGHPLQFGRTPACQRCGAHPGGAGRDWRGIQWVASPPQGPPRGARPARRPYSGPPSYPFPPRWGFPRLTWRRSAPFATPEQSPAEQMRAMAGSTVPLLWIAGAIALGTGLAELSRYLILLDSRTDAVAQTPLFVSDLAVLTGGVVSLIASALAALATLTWLVRAYLAAAEAAGVRPARPTWQLIAGVLIPGVNLLLPGAILAEIEHAAMGNDPNLRPRPSRLLVAWWIAWAAGLLLGVLAMLWGLRSGVQAQADSVLLHIAVDVTAALVALLTVRVVHRLTALLGPLPADRVRRMVVVRVGPADATEFTAAAQATGGGA